MDKKNKEKVDEEARRRLVRATCEFYRCPNSGRVIDGPKGHDDKVICACGKKNPSPIIRDEPIDRGGWVHHYKAWLPSATADDWFEQQDLEDARGNT